MFGRRKDAETEREIRAHLEIEAEELRERGVSESEAAYAARRNFGNTTLIAEACRELAGRGTLGRLVADSRQGLRALLRKPGYALIAVLTLALGIAANAVIFSIVNAVLLRPLSYPNASRAVTILHGGRSPVSPADFLDWQREARSFERMEAASMWGATLTGTERAEEIRGLQMTPGMFSLLGTHAALGRTLGPEDKYRNVVVLSHGLWQRRFGGDPSIAGRAVRLSGKEYTVVGVMPADFSFPPFWATGAEMWVPVEEPPASRNARMLRVFGLLKPGVDIRAAQLEMDAICARLSAAYPDSNAGLTAAVQPLEEKVVGPVRTPLLILFGAVGLVMLIACGNIANLTLARALERRREIGIRLALGAGRLRIARQFLTESVLVSVLGGIAGIALSFEGVELVKAMARLPRLDTVAIDSSVLLFTAVLAVMAGIVFGFVPALQAARFDVNSSLREYSRGASESGRGLRLRRVLVVAEMAVCLVLLAGAGVLLRSYLSLRAVDPGFDPRNVLTTSLSVAGREEYRGASRDALYNRILEAAGHLPGVESAALINHIPIGGDSWGTRVAAEEAPLPRPGEERTAVYRVASPGYFRTMKIRMVRGRDFAAFDRESSPRVAIINESLAKTLWHGQDPIGKRLTMDDPRTKPNWITVAGVIRDVRQQDWAAAPESEIYVPYAQDEGYRNSTAPARSAMTLVVRTAGDAAGLAEPLRREIAGIDPDIPLTLRPFDQVVAGALWQARFTMLLIGIFAGFALLLAGIGIYGVMSFLAASRAKEIGIRMALGASRTGVLRMMLRQGLALTLAGVAAGLALALGFTRVLTTVVYGVSPTDAVSFVAAPAILLIIALAAILGPALKASGADPAGTLRAG